MLVNILYDLTIIIFSGKSRARDAALNAIQSPLLDIGIERASGIVWNITGGSDLTLLEVGRFLGCILGTLLLLKLEGLGREVQEGN